MPFPTHPYGIEVSYYPQHSRYRAGCWARMRAVLLGLVLLATLCFLLTHF